MIDIEKLKAKAIEASRASDTGEWRYDKRGQMIWGHGIGGCSMQPGNFLVADIRGWGHLQYHENGAALQDATGEFIAAANPSVVLDLIKEIETLRDSRRLACGPKRSKQCAGCNGAGKDFYNGIGEQIEEVCPYCKGSGYYD
jgi:hypothetical protein